MELSRHLTPKQILLGVKAADKWELLEKMLDALLAGPQCRDLPEEVRRDIRREILRRERISPTAMGEALAYPHARVGQIKSFAMCLAVPDKPMEYDGAGAEPVELVCMVVAPQDNPMVGLQVMRVIAELWSQQELRDALRPNGDPQRVFALLAHRRIAVDVPVTAKQLMRPPLFDVYVDTPLRELTRRMLEHRVEAVCVQDHDGHVVGQITCDELFRRGLPDFFSKLPTVAFLRQFDPFEAYFRGEAEASAGDVMSADVAVVTEHATLMEIVHLLSVQRRAKLYVVRQGRRVGVIDRIAVLDRVINP